MKKLLVSMMLLTATSVSTRAENEITIPELLTNVTAESSLTSSSALSVEDNLSSLMTISYSAGFEDAGKGIFSVLGTSYWGKSRFGYGFALGVGFNFRPSSWVSAFKAGPSVCFLVTKNFFLEMPVCATYSTGFASIGNTTINSNSWGATMSPTLGVKIGRFALAASFDLSWANGANKLGTGFTVKIGSVAW